MFRQFKRLYPYLWRYRLALLGGTVCLIVANYLDIRVAVLLGNGIDLLRLSFGKFAFLQRSLLTLFIVLTVGMGLLSAVARFWMREWIIGVSRHVEYLFRKDFFRHLLKLSAPFYDRYRTGDIMSRATSDMDAIRMVIGPAVMYMSNTLALIPMTLTQMLRLSPLLTALCWLPMLLIAPVFYLFSHRIHRRFKRTQEQMSNLSANIQETLSGARVIKVYAREDAQAAGFDELSRDYVAENLLLARLQACFIPLLGLIVGLALLMLLWGGSWLIIHNRLTIGGLVTFFVLLMANIWPMAAFGWVLAMLERGAASMQRVEEYFARQPDVVDHAGTIESPPPLLGRIELRDLTFTFPGAAHPSLAGVTLTIPAGTTLGLTGPVGCGKSTLAALLARRYNPPRGAILIDGIDILDWPVDHLRRRIGIVDQEPFLFSDSIEANIAYGLDGHLDGPSSDGHQDGHKASPDGRAVRETNDADAIKTMTRNAARIAQLAQDVESFPAGYETLLGERGINLSGGQRQRAALARALARDPALLILDDALAAVDTQTEEVILRGLRQVLAGRTTILISHRISTVSLADQIVYLENGAVAEQGTHDELMALQGKYYALAMRQRLAEEIEKTA